MNQARQRGEKIDKFLKTPRNSACLAGQAKLELWPQHNKAC
jgi:hypothetical protein